MVLVVMIKKKKLKYLPRKFSLTYGQTASSNISTLMESYSLTDINLVVLKKHDHKIRVIYDEISTCI